MGNLNDKYLIGLFGEQGAGKDTVAELIQTLFPARVTLHSFASLIHLICHKGFNVPQEVLNSSQLKNTTEVRSLPSIPMTVRQLMQRLGDSIRSGVRESVFNDLLHNDLQQSKGTICIVKDVREPAEASFLRGNNGIIVQVVRPDNPVQQSSIEHRSETGMRKISPNLFPDKTPMIVNNSGNKDTLLAEIKRVILDQIPVHYLSKPYDGYISLDEAGYNTYIAEGKILECARPMMDLKM